MPSFTWNDNVPFSTNNPSDDQPKMLTNTQSTKLILNQDHYTFESITAAGDSDGWHRRVYFPVFTDPVPTAPFPETGAIYTRAGVADTDRPLLSFLNDRSSFPLSGIRAMGVFTGIGTGALTLDNSINVVSGNAATVGVVLTFTITLTTNVVIGTNAVVLVSASRNYDFLYASMTAADTLTINIRGAPPNPIISFTVLQV